MNNLDDKYSLKLISLLMSFIIFMHPVLFSQKSETIYNKLPIVNFEISTVSKSSFTAPVWLKFYPVGTYDPDGEIVLFEMDMNGDGIYDVMDEKLKGSSYQFLTPGEYTASVRVTDNNGGITTKSKSFVIFSSDNKVKNEVVAKNDAIDYQSHESSENKITIIPSDAWEETSIPWIKVWAPNGNSIVTKEIDSIAIPVGNFKIISPIISIEPQGDNTVLGAVRVKMPESIHIPNEDKERVALAFYEDGYFPSTGEVESSWRYHAVDYDPETDTYEAQMNHGSVVVWGLLTFLGVSVGYLVEDDATRLLMTKKESAHFVLHYNQKEISEKTATFTLNKLEEAQTFLTKEIPNGGLGLDYPSIPAKMDVYFVTINSKKSVHYGGYLQSGKTSAKWMDLNLPSNIPNYDSNILIATLVHELFHFIQYSNYNNATYIWLNEALSTSVEYNFVKSKYFVPDDNEAIMEPSMLNIGLKGHLTPDDGYSVGLFIDFLVHRYGIGIYSTILNECKRQVESGTEQSPFIAIQRAIFRLGRKQYPSKRDWAEMDVIWQAFTDAFIKEKSDPQLIDARLNRNTPYKTPTIRKLTIGETEVVKEWSIKVPSLSLKPLASRTYDISPSKYNDEDKARIDCKLTFTPQEKTQFEITTLIAFANKKSKKAFLPIQARTIGRITDKTLELTFTLNLEKKNRYNLLSFIPTGLGAKKNQGVAKGNYELTCKLSDEENIEILPEVPISTDAIDTYWWAYLKAATEIKNGTKSGFDFNNEGPLGILYNNAQSEWKPLNERIMALSKRKDEVYDKLKEVLDMYYKYNNQINNYSDSINALVVSHNITPSEYKVAIQKLDAMSLSNDKMRFLQSVSTNYNDCTNTCIYPLNIAEYFSNIRTIGMKATVLIYPSRFRSLHLKKSSKLPTTKEIQNVLDNFHKGLAQLSPCQNALSSFEKYWEKNEKEALKIIEEIKILHSSLK